MAPALSATEASALRAFAAAVKELLGDDLARMRLFGSRARGDGHEDSDLDVAIIAKHVGRARLGFEPAQPVRIAGDVRRQDLDGDVASEPAVVRAIDLAHPAGADDGAQHIRPEACALVEDLIHDVFCGARRGARRDATTTRLCAA